jgi:hypothetical protein
MKPTKTKKGKSAPAPKVEAINVRISRGAYDIIAKEAKLTRRTFITTMDMVLGV